MDQPSDNNTLDLKRVLIAALQLQQSGDMKGAVEIYRDVLQVAPDNADAHHLLGLAAAQTGNLEIAEQLLSRAVSLNPGEASYALDFGRILRAAGKQELALGNFQHALELNPGSPECLVELGNICLDGGDAPGAARCFEAVLLTDPVNVPAIHGLRSARSAGKSGTESETPPSSSESGNRPTTITHAGIPAAIAEAVALQQAGQGAEAATIYKGVLALEPDNPDAHNLLGVLTHEQGDHEAAVQHLKKALERAGDIAMVHSNLGLALHAQGKIAEAIQCYEKAATLDPAMAEAFLNLGTTYEETKNAEAALDCYRRAIELRPGFAKAFQNLGKLLNLLHGGDTGTVELECAVALAPLSPLARVDLAAAYMRLEREKEAEPHLDVAMALAPDLPEVQNTFGWLLQKKGQFQAALACYERACELRPTYPEALNNLGAVLNELGRCEDAIAPLKSALELKPRYVEPIINLSVVLNNLDRYGEALDYAKRGLDQSPNTPELWNSAGCIYRNFAQFDKAEQHFRRALELKPGFLDALNNEALMLRAKGHPEEAEALYREALKLGRHDIVLKWNLGLALISQGKFTEGWEFFELRWQTTLRDVAGRFPQRWWHGEPLAGKRILLRAEQGVGDEVMFASPIGDVVSQAADCLIEVDPRLVPLFQRSFPGARVFPRTNPPAAELMESSIDYQAPFGNLFRWLRPNYEAFPRQGGFLRADAGKAAAWRERLRQHGDGLIVGISWRSGLMTHLRKAEFTELPEWGPIFALPGLIFVNLQYDNCGAELEDAERRFGVKIHAFDELDLYNDLDGAAALTAACDVVVSAGTSVSAMAGAVGVPCYRTTVPEDWTDLGADWVPLMPSVTLVKRRLDEGWDRVIVEVAASLRERATA